MNFLLFNFFSTLEVIAIIVLLLSIFKYRVSDYIPQIMLTSLTMSLISYTLHFELENSNLVPIVSIITLILFIWIAFKVSFFYASVISIVGYVTYGLLQAVLLYSFQNIDYLSLEKVEAPFSPQGFLMQTISSLIAIFIAFLLRRYNRGFNWIPYSRRAKFKLKGDNILLFFTVIFSVIITGLLLYLYLSGYLHLFAIFALILIVLSFLYYLSGKQEGKYYD